MDEPPPISPHHRIRSSIACARCRRSKIKCLNTGPNTTCKACASSGRECVYPTPGFVGSKREGDGIEKGEPKRSRVRKSEGNTADTHATHGGSPRPLGDALDPSVLTPKVWQEVFDLFQLHFATDLPFLHAPTFLGPLCEAATRLGAVVRSGTPDPEDAVRVPGTEMLLLGLLSLTARFHPGLIAYHSGKDKDGDEPINASEYYAMALRALLVGVKGIYIGQPNVQKIQALLMLGLHEWGMCKGIKAWIHVGLAIRMAQALGLQFDDDLDDEPWALSSAMRIEAQHLGVGASRHDPLDPDSSEAFIEEEMRRRTFWSCFVMDRYLSSGKYRPAMLSVEDVRLQLPSSEHAFAFGERVCTNMIDGTCSSSGIRAKKRAWMFAKNKNKTADRERRDIKESDKSSNYTEDPADGPEMVSEVGPEEGLLSRFIRMVEIWGKIAKWSCAGGRRTEKFFPWQPQSKFYQLRESLAKFHDSISRPFRLTPTNIQAHLTQRTSSPFTLLHTLYSLCLIILHREYIPFVPIRCEKPEGPLDHPAPPSQEDMPKGFWEDSARELFKAGREMMDLVQACQARGLLVETPILGFGIYSVAFVGVYAINFPHMDPDGYMCGRNGDPNDEAGGQQAARKALEMIGQMRSRLPMATNWFRTIHRVHRYYEKIIGDYKANTQALREGSSNTNSGERVHRQLTLREGGLGGGAESFQLLEKTLKEFGSIEDEDVEAYAGERDRRGRASFTGSNAGEGQTRIESRPTEFTAINSIVGPSDARSTALNIRTHSTSAESSMAEPQLRHLNQLRTAPTASSPNPPSLVSPGSTSTPSLASASPYHPPTYSPDHYNQPTPRLPQTQPYNNNPQPVYAVSQAPLTTLESSHSRYWSQEMQDVWLDSLRKPLGGDDVALFVDGRSCEEWQGGYGGGVGGGFGGSGGQEGWLSEVWGGHG